MRPPAREVAHVEQERRDRVGDRRGLRPQHPVAADLHALHIQYAREVGRVTDVDLQETGPADRAGSGSSRVPAAPSRRTRATSRSSGWFAMIWILLRPNSSMNRRAGSSSSTRSTRNSSVRQNP